MKRTIPQQHNDFNIKKRLDNTSNLQLPPHQPTLASPTLTQTPTPPSTVAASATVAGATVAASSTVAAGATVAAASSNVTLLRAATSALVAAHISRPIIKCTNTLGSAAIGERIFTQPRTNWSNVDNNIKVESDNVAANNNAKNTGSSGTDPMSTQPNARQESSSDMNNVEVKVEENRTQPNTTAESNAKKPPSRPAWNIADAKLAVNSEVAICGRNRRSCVWPNTMTTLRITFPVLGVDLQPYSQLIEEVIMPMEPQVCRIVLGPTTDVVEALRKLRTVKYYGHGNLNVEVDLDPDELQKIDPYTLDVFRIDRTIDLSFLRKYFNLGIGFHKYEKLPNVHVEYDSVHDAIDEFERAQQAIGDRVLVQFKRTPADPMLEEEEEEEPGNQGRRSGIACPPT